MSSATPQHRPEQAYRSLGRALLLLLAVGAGLVVWLTVARHEAGPVAATSLEQTRVGTG